MYLWDTDWTVDYLNGKESAIQLFSEQADEGIAISIISYAEIYEGVLGSSRRDARVLQLNEFVEMIDVISVDFQVAQGFSEIRLNLRRNGRPIPDLDAFIAATAIRNSLALVSRDHHFDGLAGLRRYSA